MRDLSSTLRFCFEDLTSCVSMNISTRSTTNTDPKYMTISLIGNTLEIPLLALSSLESGYKQNSDVIVASLNTSGRVSRYKSLEAGLKDTIVSDVRTYDLIQLPTKESEPKYYATCGAIFDKHFMPVMIMSWEFEKVSMENEELPFKLKFIRPILRISPNVVVSKSNTVERFIVNKVLTSALSLYGCYRPYMNGTTLFDNSSYNDTQKIKVIIDQLPFDITSTDVPSIDTTNEELLQVALDNIDELVQ